MDRNLVVIDNFLDDPDYIREIALGLDFDNYNEHVPGVRSASARGDYETLITSKFEAIFKSKIT